MPINIFSQSSEQNERIAGLCEHSWELPTQIEALEKWLLEHGKRLQKGMYVADIGYSPRPGACGGGAVVSITAMQVMVAIGMALFLSEYPDCVDEIQPR